jgi:hypothetical protein
VVSPLKPSISLIDLLALAPAAQKVLSKQLPGPALLMAAKGIVPGLKPADLITVVSVLSQDDDPQLASAARGTLANLPPAIVQGALSSPLQEPVIACLALQLGDQPNVVEQLLRMPAIGADTLVHLATHATESIGELIATNENLLLKHPVVIETLYLNKRVRMSTADRLIELAVRNGIELAIPAFKLAAQAIANELIPEATEEPNFDDLLFQEAERLAEAAELELDDDTFEVNDEGEERLKEKFIPLHAQIAQMSITQKIRRATLGNSAERLLLVRDTNRLVASAAASSPMLNENEAARIAASRNVIDDVLRIIAQNRSFTRSYQVKLNLISNPRTPFTFSSRMIPHLRDNDVRNLAKSKNVPANIQLACRQQMQRKISGKS